NLISGNLQNAIDLESSNGVQILDNLIGTDITGTKAVGNKSDAVLIDNSSFNIVDSDIIGGNSGDGIFIFRDNGKTADNNEITDCVIGASDRENDVSLPNGGNGIEIQANNNDVSNTSILNNGGIGLSILGNNATGNDFFEGAIFNNGLLGINVGDDFINTDHPNHAANVSGAALAENGINHPILTSAIVSGMQTTVAGTFVGTPNTDYSIAIYSSHKADPSGFGQGEESQPIQNDVVVTTDNNGNATFSFVTTNNEHLLPGDVVSAIAYHTTAGVTDMSEFSNAIKVSGTTISGSVFNDVNGNGKQDAGETGLKGRTVFVDVNHRGLFNSRDFSATTDSHGHYTILGVSAGSNRVRLLGTAGWQQTSPSPKSASQTVSVAALSTTDGVLFGQEKSTAAAATLAIDAGSTAAYVDLSGQTFAADAQHPSSSLLPPVAGTDDDPLYSVETGGPAFGYTYAVPNGKYTLRLFFFDPESTASGQRVFNVTANGATVLKHFDVFAAAGAVSTAVTKTVPLTISNKMLELDFNAITGAAIVSAFELIPT
ncbi:MAG TPA: malectin domain-containing carbohydrate-binding protein, partial [Tepidisphaeraceae bacterium]|nr:malectin domain-containing carbohydrate-binding protein [Tepidisphaeraceae bacterium]